MPATYVAVSARLASAATCPVDDTGAHEGEADEEEDAAGDERGEELAEDAGRREGHGDGNERDDGGGSQHGAEGFRTRILGDAVGGVLYVDAASEGRREEEGEEGARREVGEKGGGVSSACKGEERRRQGRTEQSPFSRLYWLLMKVRPVVTKAALGDKVRRSVKSVGKSGKRARNKESAPNEVPITLSTPEPR